MLEKDERFRIKRNTMYKRIAHSFLSGCKQIAQSPVKQFVVAAYILVFAFLWLMPCNISNTDNVFAVLRSGLQELLVPIVGVIGLIAIICYYGMLFHSLIFEDKFLKIGLVNKAGETPYLQRKVKSKDNPDIYIYKFQNCGIPLFVWEEFTPYIETIMNVVVAQIEDGDNKSAIYLYAAPAKALSNNICWQKEFLTPDDSVFALGENELGRVTVDMQEQCHLLIAGKTGCGKTMLEQNILMQAVHKGWDVLIVDFKRGTNFRRIWRRYCHFVTEIHDFKAILDNLWDRMKERQDLFEQYDCSNIDEYNAIAEKPLVPILLCVDELAEATDPTGLDKEGKATVGFINQRLNSLSRLARSYSIHLLICTQRPDVEILKGQTRLNFDRIVGRCDPELAIMLFGNTDAYKKLPKITGRFMLQDGRMFQGYFFDIKTIFDTAEDTEHEHSSD